MAATKNKVNGVVMTPAYWDEACKHLVKKDRVMKRLIPQFGDACLQSRGDAFTTLARSIVGQQISVKAAQSVWERFAALPARMTPASVLKLKVDDMRAGLSARKVEYLVDLALHFDAARCTSMNGGDGRRGHHRRAGGHPRHRPLDGRDVPDLPPAAPQRAAAGRRGPDQGHQQNYFSGEPVSRSDAREVAAGWAPWRSVATWYIWRSLEPLPVAY
jgi:DNA-3-methyladenine glycosylase II